MSDDPPDGPIDEIDDDDFESTHEAAMEAICRGDLGGAVQILTALRDRTSDPADRRGIDARLRTLAGAIEDSSRIRWLP